MPEFRRLNVRITADLHDWYKSEAERLGLNVNAIMVLALNQYYKEQMVLPQLPKMVEMYEILSKEQNQKTLAIEEQSD